MKRLLFAVVSAVVVATSIVSVTQATSRHALKTVVAVSGKEFKFTLSRKSGSRGVFLFKFKNVGTIAHDFKIAGKKTPQIQPGTSTTLTVKIAKAGRYPYVCTVPGHAAAGMKGVFIVR
jgi:uncharacterized cupredoxin-like copper-binding protein